MGNLAGPSKGGCTGKTGTFATFVSSNEGAKGNGSRTQSCPKCHQSHKLQNCTEFKSLPCRHRWDLVRLANLCVRCLQHGHWARDCSATCCTKCSANHHVRLHLSDNECDGWRNGQHHDRVPDCERQMLVVRHGDDLSAVNTNHAVGHEHTHHSQTDGTHGDDKSAPSSLPPMPIPFMTVPVDLTNGAKTLRVLEMPKPSVIN